MANAKFKLYGVTADGDTKLMATESHPKLDASQEDMSSALEATADLYGYQGSHIALSSDTVVFQAD